MRTLTFCEQAILDCLEKFGPSIPKQISELSGVAYRSLYGQANYLKRMKESGLIHITDWHRQKGHGGPPQPVYALGPGEDAKKPDPLSNNVKCRRYQRCMAKPRSIIKTVLFAGVMPCHR